MKYLGNQLAKKTYSAKQSKPKNSTYF